MLSTLAQPRLVQLLHAVLVVFVNGSNSVLTCLRLVPRWSFGYLPSGGRVLEVVLARRVSASYGSSVWPYFYLPSGGRELEVVLARNKLNLHVTCCGDYPFVTEYSWQA